MDFPDTLNALVVARQIADRLDEDQLACGVGGALALGAWGAPRATKDVDITVFVFEDDLPRCFDALERAGVIIDRAGATRDVARIGLFKGREPARETRASTWPRARSCDLRVDGR